MKSRLSAAAAVALSVLVAACDEPAGPGGRPTAAVVMKSADAFAVEGRTTNRRGLAARLKAAGAGADTQIRVSVPETATNADLSVLARELAGAGFRRFAFTRPLEVSASAQDAANAAQQAGQPAPPPPRTPAR
jgi:hypothetical protein